MLQIEMPYRGLDVQLPGGKVWVSPARDIIHCFVPYIKMSLEYVEKVDDPVVTDLRKKTTTSNFDKELERLIKRIVKFISLSNEKSGSISTVKEVYGEINRFEDIDQNVQFAFKHALFNVVFSAYFNGVVEANAGEFRPYLFGPLDRVLGVKYIPPMHKRVIRRVKGTVSKWILSLSRKRT